MTSLLPVETAAVPGSGEPQAQNAIPANGFGSAAALLLGLSGAVALRIGVGGMAGVRDPRAGLAFAAVLVVLCLCVQPMSLIRRLRPTSRVRLYRPSAASAPRNPGPEGGFGMQSRTRGVRDVRGVRGGLVAGAAGAGVLCLVPLVVHLRTPAGALDPHDFGLWAAVVTAVAVAEEAFLRGALWTAVVRGRGGETAALLVTTVAFGLLHVPFYGTDALPLDLAVGLLLGGLRQLTGGWTAPAVAHTIADLAGWWLR